MPSSHVRVQGVVKRFGAFTALDGVSLDIADGELVCCLGPSGCGKTTLLRVVAGLERQDDGTIEIAGRDVSAAPPSARDFGIVFQSYALFPNLTAAQNIGYGLVNRGLARAAIAARVSELEALVGLEGQARKFPNQLSGGQQQRVALARALATRPGLLLLDEPLSALDARVRVRLREEIKQLQRRLGLTVLMVTHDQDEALSMADRVIVMNAGRIEQTGTPREIYAEPRSAFVAQFIGTTSFFDAVLAPGGAADLGWVKLEVAANGHPGGSVRLGVRPEAIRVSAAALDRGNHFAARVTAVDYFGAFSRVMLAPQAKPDVALRADVSAQAALGLDLSMGALLQVTIPAAAIAVFAAGEAGT